MSVFGVILVRIFPRIFPHLEWIFSPNVEKCGKNADQNNSEYGHLLGCVCRLPVSLKDNLQRVYFICFNSSVFRGQLPSSRLLLKSLVLRWFWHECQIFFIKFFKEPKIQNFGKHGATSETYWVYYKPPVLSYSEVGKYAIKDWLFIYYNLFPSANYILTSLFTFSLRLCVLVIWTVAFLFAS